VRPFFFFKKKSNVHSGVFLSEADDEILLPSAFRSLGPAANAFLFSPFGFHILRYILSFHIVPDIIWNTDHCERTKVSTSSAGAGGAEACTLDSHTYEQDEFTGPIGLHPFPPTPGKVNV
jgi:hypothetical protein